MRTNTIITGLIAAALTSAALGRTIPTHASADLVLGQPDFTHQQPGTSATQVDGPKSVAVDPTTRKVFVCDERNNRVLRYASAASLANGTAAEAVLGQPDFTTSVSASVSSQSMSRPSAVFVDRLGRLWVADRSNGRVLRFSDASNIASHSAADRVYGQLDFTSDQYAVSASRMVNPTGVWVDASDRLWVADDASCRILRFDDVSNKANGADADGVLGQPDFVTGSQSSGINGFQRVDGVAVSPTGSLFVACSRGNRVLRFDNAASLANGANASAVFGQADFDGEEEGLSATQMYTPYGLTIAKDDTLWVSDRDNNRLLRFDKASIKSSGAAADGVIGQADFVSNLTDTTEQSLSYPNGNPFVDDQGALWVVDSSNYRILRFPAVISQPVVTVTAQVAKKTKKKSVKIKGIATDPNDISRVQYQLGSGALKTASGNTAWNFTQNLKKGKNTITLFATDVWGDESARSVIKITRKDSKSKGK